MGGSSVGLVPAAGSRYLPAMRRVLAAAGLAFLTGCSNAPIAGFLDAVAPSSAERPSSGTPGPVVPPGGRPVDSPLPPADLGPPVGPRP